MTACYINDRNGMKIGIGNLPGRKKPCLYIYTSANRKVGSFDDEESAQMFIDYFNRMIGEENADTGNKNQG